MNNGSLAARLRQVERLIGDTHRAGENRRVRQWLDRVTTDEASLGALERLADFWISMEGSDAETIIAALEADTEGREALQIIADRLAADPPAA